MSNDSLGDRMKAYENVSRTYMTRRTPVVLRIDGKAFHTFTRNFDRPFDMRLIRAMTAAAKAVAEQAQGFKVGYIQSDEASFVLTDYDTLTTSAWFDNNVQKMASVAASVMTAHFNAAMSKENLKSEPWPLAYFDGRVFCLPKEEVSNYFLWRQKDWERNSLQMYCRSFFSQKQMHGKGKEQMHEMLYNYVDAEGKSSPKNWAVDLGDQVKNGTYLYKKAPTKNWRYKPNGYEIEYYDENDGGVEEKYDVMPTYDAVSAFVNPLVKA